MPGPLTLSPRPRLAVSLLLGVVLGAALCPVLGIALGAIAGITLAELVFLASSWAVLWPMDAERTREHARGEDLRPAADEVLIASLAALGVVSIVLLHLGAIARGATTTLGAALTLLGVFGAWACVHLTFAVRYAHRYYDQGGGLDFGSPHEPRYTDFLYVAYAVGMTYGITDTDTTDPGMRRIVLRHALVSFGFGMVVLGAAVNLVTGLFGLV